MKKLISALFASLCFVGVNTSANAQDVAFSIGFAGNQGGYHARGTETIQQTRVGGNTVNITQEAGVFEDSHP